MIVSLFLIAVSVLPNPQDVMPPAGAVTSRLTSDSQQALAAAAQCQKGWGLNPKTGKYTFTVQIAPAALPMFSAGERGNDMRIEVPGHIRPFVEEVVVRVGSGPLEQQDPTPEMRNSLARQSQPTLSMLDNRSSPVQIDEPILHASGTGINNTNPNAGQISAPYTAPSPTNSPSTNSFSNNVLPPSTAASSRPGGNITGGLLNEAPSLAIPGYSTGVPPIGQGGSLPSTSSATAASNPTRTDGFTPTNGTTRPSSSMLDRMMGSSGASVAPPYSSTANGFPRVATNPTAPNNPLDFGMTNGIYPPSVPPGYGASTGVGGYLPNTGIYPPTTGMGSTIPTIASVPGTMVPGTMVPSTGTVTNSTGTSTVAPPQPQVSQGRDWLPIISLLLLIMNIYQFLWMAHVHTRYKEMVISKRNAQLNLAGS